MKTDSLSTFVFILMSFFSFFFVFLFHNNFFFCGAKSLCSMFTSNLVMIIASLTFALHKYILPHIMLCNCVEVIFLQQHEMPGTIIFVMLIWIHIFILLSGINLFIATMFFRFRPVKIVWTTKKTQPASPKKWEQCDSLKISVLFSLFFAEDCSKWYLCYSLVPIYKYDIVTLLPKSGTCT